MYESELEFAIDTAKGAGEIIKKHFGRIKVGKPRDAVRGLLSTADTESDDFICGAIERTYPQDSILSEERAPKEGNRRRWVVDPLDGTTNFTYGLADFIVYIALATDNLPVIGVAHDPISGTVYHAVKGQGAYRNGERLTTSTREMDEALIILANDYMFPKLRNRGIKLLGLLTEETEQGRQRTFRQRIAEGGNRLVNIADGVYDAFVIDQTKPWDIAAAGLIVEEAGGRVTDHKGNPWQINTRDIVMTNGIIHSDMLGILRQLETRLGL